MKRLYLPANKECTGYIERKEWVELSKLQHELKRYGIKRFIEKYRLEIKTM